MSTLALILSLLLHGGVAVYDSTDANYHERHIGIVAGRADSRNCGFELSPYFGGWCDTGPR